MYPAQIALEGKRKLFSWESADANLPLQQLRELGTGLARSHSRENPPGLAPGTPQSASAGVGFIGLHLTGEASCEQLHRQRWGIWESSQAMGGEGVRGTRRRIRMEAEAPRPGQARSLSHGDYVPGKKQWKHLLEGHCVRCVAVILHTALRHFSRVLWGTNPATCHWISFMSFGSIFSDEERLSFDL